MVEWDASCKCSRTGCVAFSSLATLIDAQNVFGFISRALMDCYGRLEGVDDYCTSTPLLSECRWNDATNLDLTGTSRLDPQSMIIVEHFTTRYYVGSAEYVNVRRLYNVS